MIYNSNNTKYKSVLAGLTFGAWQIGNAAVEIRGGVGRRMETKIRPRPSGLWLSSELSQSCPSGTSVAKLRE